MNRKGLLVLMVAVLAVGSAFAQPPEFKLSAGAGGLFINDFGGGWEGVEYYNFEMPFGVGGGFVFFDATFVELTLGFFGGWATWKQYPNPNSLGEYQGHTNFMGLDISLLGKYPFTLGDKLTLFPLLGITYCFLDDYGDYETKHSSPGDFNALWYKLGAGMDYTFTDHLYGRVGILYGIRHVNKYEKDWGEAADDGGKARLGHGLDIRLAVGYTF